MRGSSFLFFDEPVPSQGTGSIGTFIGVPLLSLALSFLTPGVSAGKVVAPPVASLTLTIPAPSIPLGVAPSNLTLTLVAPSVSAGVVLSPAMQTLTLDLHAPAVETTLTPTYPSNQTRAGIVRVNRLKG